MPKIIVVIGPTGVGKTSLSLKLAKEYNAEIVNADAMQIYKEMNIEKSARNNMVIVLLLLAALILNIINIWFLPK